MAFSSLTPTDWVYVVLCTVTMGFSYSIVTVGTPIFPQYFRESHAFNEHELNVTVTVGNITTIEKKIVYENEAIYNGIMFASYEATQILTQPLYGLFVRRKITPRMVIMFVMPLFVITSLLFAFCNTYEALLASRSLQGFVGAGINTCGYTILSNRFTGKTRLSVISCISVSFILFSQFVPAVGGALYDGYGKTITFLSLTCFAGVINISWISLSGFEFLQPSDAKVSDESPDGAPESKSTVPVSYCKLLTSITPMMVYLAKFLTFVPYVMMSPLLSNRLHELETDMTQRRVGLILVYALVGVVMGYIIIHHMTKRKWYLHVYPIITCMASLGISCVIAALATNYWQMCLSLTIMCGVHYVSAVANGSMICDYVNKRCQSANTVTATSLLFIVDNLGAITALLSGGVAVKTFGYITTWMALGTVYGLVTIMMLMWVRYERNQVILL